MDSKHFLKKFKSSKKYELVQRLKEFETIENISDLLKESHLLTEVDEKLSFLDDYVKKCLISGYQPIQKTKPLSKLKSEHTIEDLKKETNQGEEDSKINFKGKKVWGMPEISENPDTNKKPAEKSENNLLDGTEEKVIESKPINVVFSPMEEFASKVFKGVLDEVRTKKNILNLNNNKVTKFFKKEDEENINLVEENSTLKSFSEYLRQKDYKKLDSLFLSIPIFNEIDLEMEKLNNEDIQRFADNFSLIIITSENKRKDFFIAGIKSNEMIICKCEEGTKTLKFRFKCTSSQILKKLMGFIKEYINLKGYKLSI